MQHPVTTQPICVFFCCCCVFSPFTTLSSTYCWFCLPRSLTCVSPFSAPYKRPGEWARGQGSLRVTCLAFATANTANIHIESLASRPPTFSLTGCTAVNTQHRTRTKRERPFSQRRQCLACGKSVRSLRSLGEPALGLQCAIKALLTGPTIHAHHTVRFDGSRASMVNGIGKAVSLPSAVELNCSLDQILPPFHSADFILKNINVLTFE